MIFLEIFYEAYVFGANFLKIHVMTEPKNIIKKYFSTLFPTRKLCYTIRKDLHERHKHTKELEQNSHTWIKALSHNLPESEAQEFMDKTTCLQNASSDIISPF